MLLPQPVDLTSLVLRTDFSADPAWELLQAAIDSSDEYPSDTYVSEPAYAGVTVQALVDADAEASDDDKLTYLFLADATTMIDDEQPQLAVDLYTGPGRQEGAVGDLCVGQAVAGEDGDLALLGGELGEGVACGRRDRVGYPAGAQFRFRPPGPRRGAQVAERLQCGREDGFGLVDAPLPAQPLPVVEPQLGPLERPLLPGRLGQCLVEVRLGLGGFGEQPAGAGRELVQPGDAGLVHRGQRAFDQRPGFEPTFRSYRGRGEVGDAQVGHVVVQWRAVGVEEVAKLGVGRQVTALGERRHSCGVAGAGGGPPVIPPVGGHPRLGPERPSLFPVAAQGEEPCRAE